MKSESVAGSRRGRSQRHYGLWTLCVVVILLWCRMGPLVSGAFLPSVAKPWRVSSENSLKLFPMKLCYQDRHQTFMSRLAAVNSNDDGSSSSSDTATTSTLESKQSTDASSIPEESDGAPSQQYKVLVWDKKRSVEPSKSDNASSNEDHSISDEKNGASQSITSEKAFHESETRRVSKDIEHESVDITQHSVADREVVIETNGEAKRSEATPRSATSSQRPLEMWSSSEQRKVRRQPIKEDSVTVVPPSSFNVVLTHATADFDSLASAVGLAKLWTSPQNGVTPTPSNVSSTQKTFFSASHVPTFVVLPRGAHPAVQRFLALHKHLFPIRSLKSLPEDLSGLNRLALVDAQRRDRLGPAEGLLEHAKRVVVVDHHVDQESDIPATDYVVDKVGAVSTFVSEYLKEEEIELTEAEAVSLLGDRSCCIIKLPSLMC